MDCSTCGAEPLCLVACREANAKLCALDEQIRLYTERSIKVRREKLKEK